MRTLMLIAGCLLAAPGWASQEHRSIGADDLHHAAPVIRVSPETNDGGQGLETQPILPDPGAMQDWELDYIAGRRTAKTGATMGWVGLAAVGTSVVSFLTAEAMDSAYPEPLRTFLFYGLGVGGFASIQIGAPVAAFGTIKSRRALVAGGQASGPCSNCVIAAVGWVPNPFLFATLPLSYVMSAQQRRSDQVRYQRYSGLHTPRVNAGPNGVRLSWAF